MLKHLKDIMCLRKIERKSLRVINKPYRKALEKPAYNKNHREIGLTAE